MNHHTIAAFEDELTKIAFEAAKAVQKSKASPERLMKFHSSMGKRQEKAERQSRVFGSLANDLKTGTQPILKEHQGKFREASRHKQRAADRYAEAGRSAKNKAESFQSMVHVPKPPGSAASGAKKGMSLGKKVGIGALVAGGLAAGAYGAKKLHDKKKAKEAA